MEKNTDSKIINDINNLLWMGVTQTAIANVMQISRQLFNYNLKKKQFSQDQEAFFYRKYKKTA